MTPDEMIFELAAHFERQSLVAYPDPCGYWTVGIGHKILPNEQELKRGITKEQMLALFQHDLEIAKTAVARLITPDISDARKVSLWDFTFNEGEEALETSTLRKLLNANQFDAAAAQFKLWDKGTIKDKNGIVRKVELPGLKSRRLCEEDIFWGMDIPYLKAKRWYQ